MKHFHNTDVVIIDTSGRHALEAELINEIKDVAEIAKPNERILVLDATIGQQAGPQAQAFHDAVNVTLGLPIIRTSVDHGTAYNLAGTGKASEQSLLAAIRMAARMVR